MTLVRVAAVEDISIPIFEFQTDFVELDRKGTLEDFWRSFVSYAWVIFILIQIIHEVSQYRNIYIKKYI